MKNFRYSTLAVVIVGLLFVLGCGTQSISNNSSQDATGESGSASRVLFSEVEKHNNANDCWIVIDKKVYDVTKYIPQHPKGPDAVIRNCGKDGTAIFDLKHSPEKKEYLSSYLVGALQG